MSNFSPCPPNMVLGQSGAAVSCGADTTEDVLATIAVPANSMGANGQITINALFNYTNSTNSKTIKIYFGGLGGTLYFSQVYTTLTVTMMLLPQRVICNANATNSQVGFAPGSPSGLTGNSQTAMTTSAIDTTADTTIVITGQKASAGETLTLASHSVVLSPRP